MNEETCIYCQYTNLESELTTEQKIELIKQYILQGHMLVAAGHGALTTTCDVTNERALNDLEDMLESLLREQNAKHEQTTQADQKAA